MRPAISSRREPFVTPANKRWKQHRQARAIVRGSAEAQAGGCEARFDDGSTTRTSVVASGAHGHAAS